MNNCELCVIGVNHKSAPVAIREKLALQQADIAAIIIEVITTKIAQEVVLVFTCNRTEIYFYTANKLQALQWFKQHFASDSFSALAVENFCYNLFDAATVISHIMRVASGMDSMVIGEAEILGQFKAAYHAASVAGGVGKWLGRLFQSAFAVAKKVRTETKIGVNSLSVAYIAVRLAGLIFSDIGAASVLVIGAGDTAKLTIKHLLKVGVKNIFLSNRNLDRAKQLAKEINPAFCWRFLELENLPDYLAQADIVLTSTASTLPIVGKGMVESAIKTRKYKPMLMIDLAVPRDIEAEVKNLEQVYLYCIDDLQTIAESNKQLRENELSAAEEIISQQVQKFLQWMDKQSMATVVAGMRSRVHAIADECLSKSLKELQSGDSAEEALKSLAYNLTNKFLHLPTVSLQQAGVRDDAVLLRKLQEIFV